MTGFGMGLILTHVGDSADISQVLTLIKLLKASIPGFQRGEVRLIVTSSIEEQSVLSQLAFAGCKEVVPEAAPVRSFLFKVEQNLKALTALEHNKAHQRTSQKQEKKKATSRPDARVDARVNPRLDSSLEKAPIETLMFRYATPLPLESDFWCLASSQPKKVGKRVLIKLYGPTAELGRWEPGGSERVWIWRPIDLDSHPFIEDEGCWVFRGQKPEFKDNCWFFVSEEPQLVFEVLGEAKGSKIAMDHFGILVVSRDSASAQALFPLYEASAAASSNKSDLNSAVSSSGVSPHRTVFVPPLNFRSDCWLLLSRKPKFTNRLWMIKLVGPGPLAGKWTEVQGSQASKRWKWEPAASSSSAFIRDQGGWEFSGIKPRFERDGWIFVSRWPELFFKDGATVVGAKLQARSEFLLEVAEDSFVARKALTAMKQTFGTAAEMRLHSSGENLEKSRSSGLTSEFRIKTAQFGTPSGKWEMVRYGMTGKKAFVYIPHSFAHVPSKSVKMTQIQELSEYWFCRCMTEPQLVLSKGESEWVFKAVRPERVPDFGSLDRPIQNFLNRRFSSQVKTLKLSKLISTTDLQLEISRPHLTPLSLGVLVAEMVTGRSRSPKDMIQIFCSLVSSSFDGVRTEVWIVTQGLWACVNTVDGTIGQFDASLTSVEPTPQITSIGTVIAPVLQRGAEDDLILGALVFGGPGVQKVSVDSAQAYSVMLKGLVQGCLAQRSMAVNISELKD